MVVSRCPLQRAQFGQNFSAMKVKGKRSLWFIEKYPPVFFRFSGDPGAKHLKLGLLTASQTRGGWKHHFGNPYWLPGCYAYYDCPPAPTRLLEPEQGPLNNETCFTPLQTVRPRVRRPERDEQQCISIPAQLKLYLFNSRMRPQSRATTLLHATFSEEYLRCFAGVKLLCVPETLTDVPIPFGFPFETSKLWPFSTLTNSMRNISAGTRFTPKP